MVKLTVRTYKRGSQEPASTVSIPLGILDLASRLIPEKVRSALSSEGFELKELAASGRSGELRGVLLEYEDHASGEKTVISLE